jgi:hypothetical protein
MKLDPRHVRFIVPWLPRPGRRRLWVVGRGNTVQLQETAVVIEGNVKRLWMPLVDYFFQRALSEWTTVTVPYSCVLRFTHVEYLVVRAVLTVLFWALALLSLLGLSGPQANVGWVLYYCGVLAALALVMTLYLNLRLLAPRDFLVYRTADGRRMLAAFRIRSPQRREAFADLLEKNCRAAAALARPAPAPEAARGPLLPLALLAAYVAAPLLLQPLEWLVGPPAALVVYRPWSHAGRVLLPLLHMLYAGGPVLLLAALAWRWNEAVRWLAVLLLALRGAGAVIGAAAWQALGLPPPAAWGGAGQIQAFPRQHLDVGAAGLVSLGLYLVLALVLALWPAPDVGAEAVGPGG